MPIADQRLVLLLSFIIALSGAYLAKKHNRKPLFWFLMTFLFGVFGLFTLYILIFYKAKKKKTQNTNGKVKILTLPFNYLWYYLNHENQTVGPISSPKLLEEYQKGTISQNTYLWHDELETWKKPSEIKELEELFTKKTLLRQE